MTQNIIQVSDLQIYPVKSCKGLQRKSIVIQKKGPEHDRRWMLIDSSNRFMSQRQFPQMALIEVTPYDDHLFIRLPNKQEYSIPIQTKDKKIDVVIWKDTCSAIDQGEDIAQALSHFLNTDCRLVFIPDETIRQVNQKYALNPQDEVGFADGYPFLLISEASLEDLNKKLDRPLPMNRFRPNIVINGCSPYEEDTWKTIRIGEIKFSIVKPCSRCVITTIDQSTAEKSLEPLQMLSTYRKMEKGIMFGQNIIHQNLGILNVGDRIEILERK
ncbi:MAG: MOSC domain-containing protein [Parachlamydiaceae bacterium]|nr:MOSC domain-containing protein [Parachlamydiaceae bacterium]